MVNIDKIKALAKEQGITVAFICKKFGLERNYLNDVKYGKSKISDERLSIIADILNTTPEYLRDETDIKEKPLQKQELSDKEKLFMELFINASEEDQNTVLRMLKSFQYYHEEEKE